MGRKKSSKRKSSETDSATEVFPQNPIEDKNEAAVIDDLSEPTMGEKLASLNIEEKDESSIRQNGDTDLQPKPPSADSVYILLKQALRADDRTLLLECLYRQDAKVITNSLSVLNPSDVLKLLQSLVSIVQLRGAVLACAIPWLRSLLLLHAGSILSQESSFAALSSIYQIIESRVSNLDRAVELSTRLDSLYAETLDEEDGETEVIEPAIYEDDSSDEDDDDEEGMEVESVEDGPEPAIHSDISDDDED